LEVRLITSFPKLSDLVWLYLQPLHTCISKHHRPPAILMKWHSQLLLLLKYAAQINKAYRHSSISVVILWR
jgi:hypothetical protein